MATAAGEIFKEINALMRDSLKLTDGQVEVTLMEEPKHLEEQQSDDYDEDYDEEVVATLLLSVCPNGGLFQGARIKFTIVVLEGYPDSAPVVKCLNNVYHPNINLLKDDGRICVNLLDDDWEPGIGLDGTLNALLFLFHQPNGDDPLSGMWSSARNFDAEKIVANTRLAIEGETIEGVTFDRLLVEPKEVSENGGSSDEVKERNDGYMIASKVRDSEVKDQVEDRMVEKVEETEIDENDENEPNHTMQEAMNTDYKKVNEVDLICRTLENATSADVEEHCEYFEINYEETFASACIETNQRHGSSSGVDPIDLELGLDTDAHDLTDVRPTSQELGTSSKNRMATVAKFSIRLLARLTSMFSKGS